MLHKVLISGLWVGGFEFVELSFLLVNYLILVLCELILKLIDSFCLVDL